MFVRVCLRIVVLDMLAAAKPQPWASCGCPEIMQQLVSASNMSDGFHALQVDVLGESYASEPASAVTALSATLQQLSMPTTPVLAGMPA